MFELKTHIELPIWLQEPRSYSGQLDLELWFEFLTVSPSYELARREREGQLTDQERESLPKDFDIVRSTFNNLGDVQKIFFRDWMETRGKQHFNIKRANADAKILGILKTGNSDDIIESVKSYINTDWPREGLRDTLILAIPSGSPLHPSMHEVRGFLEDCLAADRINPEVKPTYEHISKRFHDRTLTRYLYVLYFWIILKKTSLWRIGEQTLILRNNNDPVCPRHGNYGEEEAKRKAPICPVHGRPIANNAERRKLLTVSTRRALDRALMIAENAARGVFPSHNSTPHAIQFDKTKLREMMIERRNWQIEKKQSFRSTIDERPLTEIIRLKCCKEPSDDPWALMDLT